MRNWRAKFRDDPNAAIDYKNHIAITSYSALCTTRLAATDLPLGPDNIQNTVESDTLSAFNN